ncbi:hypothetical protein G6L37_07320 [Agrobacterium rubi]|nr:hypothetical protein [Agrobacterium rubi]NTF25177.1 hypothetical protein [Agrobacterium rubi]
MTIGEHDKATPDDTSEIDSTSAEKATNTEQAEEATSTPMRRSQKICLSITGGFLACSVLVVFNVPAIVLSILSFFFVDHWIGTTLVLAIVMIFVGCHLNECGRQKAATLLTATALSYVTAWVAYAQYVTLSKFFVSGTIGGTVMLFSGTGIVCILAGVCGLACCLSLHQKNARLWEILFFLPLSCIWSSGLALLVCAFASAIITDANLSYEDRVAMQERPATVEQLKTIGEGAWACTHIPKSASIVCKNPGF